MKEMECVMNKKKVFCEECRKDVDFYVKEKRTEGNIKGESYSYLGKVAYCSECDSEVYVGYINDFNLRALYDVYREKNNIISLDKVLQIGPKYGIGKRPLSLLLGWGELTFSRYCDGDVPNRQYSEILEKIYDDPMFYNDILEKNKDNLTTKSAYIKSKAAVEKLISERVNKSSKINIVIEYLLNRCEDITPLALQKSLYYVQGFYYAFYNEFLFTEDCQAWVHGPVYPEIYFKYRDYRFDAIESNGEIDKSLFSSSEISILESVVNNICCYSGKILEKFTHSESPWILARGNLNGMELSDEIIKKEDIGKYFKSVKEKYDMINANDIELYSKAMFMSI